MNQEIALFRTGMLYQGFPHPNTILRSWEKIVESGYIFLSEAKRYPQTKTASHLRALLNYTKLEAYGKISPFSETLEALPASIWSFGASVFDFDGNTVDTGSEAWEWVCLPLQEFFKLMTAPTPLGMLFRSSAPSSAFLDLQSQPIVFGSLAPPPSTGLAITDAGKLVDQSIDTELQQRHCNLLAPSIDPAEFSGMERAVCEALISVWGGLPPMSLKTKDIEEKIRPILKSRGHRIPKDLRRNLNRIKTAMKSKLA